MTREDAIIRLVGDLKKHHERALAKHEMQVNLLCAYRDQLEDHVDIAAGMIVDAYYCSKDEAFVARDKDEALALIAGEYERRQAARKVAV